MIHRYKIFHFLCYKFIPIMILLIKNLKSIFENELGQERYLQLVRVLPLTIPTKITRWTPVTGNLSILVQETTSGESVNKIYTKHYILTTQCQLIKNQWKSILDTYFVTSQYILLNMVALHSFVLLITHWCIIKKQPVLLITNWCIMKDQPVLLIPHLCIMKN